MITSAPEVAFAPDPGPFLWHPRVCLRRGPLFADLYLVKICSGLKEAFLIGWVVGREAPPYALGFCGRRIERSEETPILRPSHAALTGPLSTGQGETMPSCRLTCFPFLGKFGVPSSQTQCLLPSFSMVLLKLPPGQGQPGGDPRCRNQDRAAIAAIGAWPSPAKPVTVAKLLGQGRKKVTLLPNT